MMIKKNKWRVFLSCVITLLPMLFGVLFWKSLPEKMAVTWSTSGTVTDMGSKMFVVFGIPVFALACQIFFLTFTVNDPKRRNISEKMFRMMIWIIPVVIIFAMTSIYSIALGSHLNVPMVANLLLGIVFILIGNYLPKCKQNYTVGIRIPWTLNSEENWNQTHRLAGRVMLIGGILFFVNAFLLTPWIVIVQIMIMCIPIAYSFVLYKKSVG